MITVIFGNVLASIVLISNSITVADLGLRVAITIRTYFYYCIFIIEFVYYKRLKFD